MMFGTAEEKRNIITVSINSYKDYEANEGSEKSKFGNVCYC